MSRSLYRNTNPSHPHEVSPDPRAFHLACRLRNEYGNWPSAVYIRRDGSIYVQQSDGSWFDYPNLREVGLEAAYQADQAGADKAECDRLFSLFSRPLEV